MSDTIDTARALLRQFEQSGYGDMHVRADNFALFVARANGRNNPLNGLRREGGAATPPATAAAIGTSAIVSAPHLAIMVSALAIGTAVASGDAVARIELLGEAIDLIATSAGLVETIGAEPGALLEYGDPVVTLVQAA